MEEEEEHGGRKKEGRKEGGVTELIKVRVHSRRSRN